MEHIIHNLPVIASVKAGSSLCSRLGSPLVFLGVCLDSTVDTPVQSDAGCHNQMALPSQKKKKNMDRIDLGL